MATVIWEGDATNTAQVNTGTVGGTWSTSETITTTLTAEDGSTLQSVVTTVAAGSPTVTDVRDEHLSDLQASVQSLFTKITWASSSTNAITATAKIAGEPFYISGSETATSGTFSYASTTANSGDQDWGTAANWSGGSVPTAADDVRFTAEGLTDVKYGLDQSSVDLNTLIIGEGYTGSIGDVENNYYLQIDVTNTAGDVLIKGAGDHYMLNGRMDNVQVERSSSSASAVKLDGDIDNLYVIGGGVRGTIDCKSSMILDNVFIIGSPSAKVVINSSVTSLDTIRMNGGICENESNVTAVEVAGGKYDHKGDANTCSTLDQYGGLVEYRSSGTLTTLRLHSGTFSTEKTKASTGALTITNTNVYGGLLQSEGPVSVTYSNNILKFGGIVKAPGTVVTLSQ